MPRIADDAEVGRDPLAGKDDVLEIVAAGQGECASRGPCRPQAGDKVALEPQPIVLSAIATPANHLGGSVEAVGSRITACPTDSQPATTSSNSCCVAKPMAPSVSATRHASGKARSPQRTLSIRIW